MADSFSFRLRTAQDGTPADIKILGDHRSDGFPDVGVLLREALVATQSPPPPGLIEVVRTSMLIDRFISFWTYPGGEYEIDDDVFGMFVTPLRGAEVGADIMVALTRSGKFTGS